MGIGILNSGTRQHIPYVSNAEICLHDAKYPADLTPAGSRRRNGKRQNRKSVLVAYRGPALFCADLHGLHVGLSFGSRLEYAVINHCRRRRRRPLIDDGTLFGRRVSDDIVWIVRIPRQLHRSTRH